MTSSKTGSHWPRTVVQQRLKQRPCAFPGGQLYFRPLIYSNRHHYVDGSAHDRRNSSTLAMALHLSCINPSMWTLFYRQNNTVFNSLTLGSFEWNFRWVIFTLILMIYAVLSFMTLPSDDCHWTSLMISEHWFQVIFTLMIYAVLSCMTLPSDGCHWTSLMISEHWFR